MNHSFSKSRGTVIKKHPADSQNHTSIETVEFCNSVERDKEEGISKRNFLPCFPASYPARKERHAFCPILLSY